MTLDELDNDELLDELDNELDEDDVTLDELDDVTDDGLLDELDELLEDEECPLLEEELLSSSPPSRGNSGSTIDLYWMTLATDHTPGGIHIFESGTATLTAEGSAVPSHSSS